MGRIAFEGGRAMAASQRIHVEIVQRIQGIAVCRKQTHAR
jgi:hypothetical protein